MVKNRRNRLQAKPKATTTTKVLNGQTRTITTTAAGRQADTSKHPSTGYYKPIPHIWFQHPVDLPPFTFATVRAMLMDEGIRLNFETRAAPLYGIEFGWEENKQWKEGVKCKDEAVGAFIYRQLQRIWKNFLPDIVRSQIWGWSAGEVTLKLSEETGLVEINEMLSRHPMDCKLLKLGCEKWGIQVQRIEGGTVNLPFPYAWFHSYGAEDGEDYGTSAAYGAYSAWADKWFDGGAREVRRLFMHKDAYGGVDVGYPDGETFISGYDVPIPNRDLARQIGESIRAGGVTYRPSQRDEHGNELWPLERATVASNPSHILQYPKDLDEEIRHGMGIPDDVINSGSTGSWDGKAIPMQSFYSSLDSWAIRILKDVCTQIIDHLLILNYGRKVEYETPFKSLAKQAMEAHAAEQGADKGSVQDSPFGNPQGFNQPEQATDQPEQPITLSLEGIGSVLSASRAAIARLSVDANSVVEPRKFSSTQFNLPDEVAQAVRNMASRIPDEALAEDGREDEPHITVKYGLHDESADNVVAAVKGFEPVSVKLGKASIFPANESQAQRGGSQYDVVKIDVDSEQLRTLNKLIEDSCECTNTHPTYQPHITIAYVKPGLGDGIAAMMDDLEGTELVFDRLTFSSKDRNRTEIQLSTSQEGAEKSVSLTERLTNKFNSFFQKLLRRTKPEVLIGGAADSKPDSDFPKAQLAEGIRIESEHTNDPEVAKEIAKDHLIEDPLAYTPFGREAKGNAQPVS